MKEIGTVAIGVDVGGGTEYRGCWRLRINKGLRKMAVWYARVYKQRGKGGFVTVGVDGDSIWHYKSWWKLGMYL